MKSISWQDFEKFLFYVGCTYKRQKGDHKIYWRSDLKRPIVLPMYKNIPIFIIKNNIRLLGLTSKEYLVILKKL